MTFALVSASDPASAAAAPAAGAISPPLARGLLLAAVLAAAVAGGLAADASAAARAAAHACADLTRLLRAMAAIKGAMAGAVLAAVWWRMATPTPRGWLAAYLLAAAAMAAGPGMIWSLAHVASGALLLHAGLLAGLVALWRDPAVGRRIAGIVAKRRAALR